VPPGILLDADVPPAVAIGLRRAGHDVVAASGDASLEALDDFQLLRLATRQSRVLVTFNIADFVELARTCAATREDHAGIILVHSGSFRRTEIGAIVTAVNNLVESRSAFTNGVLYLARSAP
jgi:predicted nuclease of predicted toxin-antitoxin system